MNLNYKWMKRAITIFSILFFALGSIANEEHHNNGEIVSHDAEEEFNASEAIMHHISDAHNWHLFDITNKETGKVRSISIPLPVIVLYKGQLDVFMSSKFHVDHSNISQISNKYPYYKGNNEYILYHNKIYVASNGELNFDEHHHPTNVQPVDISITKNVAAMIFSAILLLVIFITMARMYKKGNKVPRGIQGFLEPLILFVVNDIAKPNIQGDKYKKYVPFLLTVFFFIWFNNMLGLIPILPGGANVTGNIAVTMVLALFTMVITNFSGNKAYWGHIIAPPVPKWLLFIMVPVELISVISKPFALMIRLFANITAGHIIVLSLISLIFIFKTIFISPLSVGFVLFIDIIELLVAILQAYIFTLLSALYIGMAVQEHH